MKTCREHGGCSALSTLENSVFPTSVGPCAEALGEASCRSISQYPRGSSEHGRHEVLVPGKATPGSEADSEQGAATTSPSVLHPSQRGCEHPGSLPGNIPACPQLLQGNLWGCALAQSTPAALATPPLLPRCPQSAIPHCLLLTTTKSSGRTGTATLLSSALHTEIPLNTLCSTSYFSYRTKAVLGYQEEL